ncbi:MAG: T9SS type A sorting domain-containing protein [Bacteroidetes bacterium]|nr:T9SS type A sorting domain-containing protein [Bacteroidota bacterium]
MKAIFSLLLAGIIALPGIAQVNTTNNRLGFDISTFPQNNTSYTYDSCMHAGGTLGITQVGIFQNWTAIETAPNTYNFTILDIADFYYPLSNMPVDLTITPIHTNNLEVPSDLSSTPFNSPVMISRFKKLLDSVRAHTPNLVLSSLVIGSEHDVYMGSNTALWNEYKVFYDSVTAHAKTLWPGLKVATELTFNGLTTYNTQAQLLNTNSDYIGVSHYPLNTDFTVKPPANIANDLATIVGLYPTKPICFYQFGYPSSATCNSSENMQKDFITETFTAWDTYSSNIRMIDFTWLHDLSPADVAYYGTYYGITNAAFLEFLRSLGFRQWNGNGSNKPAWNELGCQAMQRGFNTGNWNCPLTTIEEEAIANASFFPNPAQGKILFNDHTSIKNIQLFNALGEQVLNGNYTSEMDISAFKPGMYLLMIEGVKTQKLIIE